MKRLSVIGVALIVSCAIGDDVEGVDTCTACTQLTVIEDAFRKHTSGVQILQEGKIVAVLTDDTEGDRHQRMIVELGNGQTLLIAHNIDIAPRVPNPKKETTLRFYGSYEWNSEGGVVHWTHKDPQGKHINGWLEYNGERYE